MFFSSNMPGTSSSLTFCMFQLYYQELFSSHFLSQLLSLINTPLSQNPNFYQFHQFLSSTQSKTYTPTTEYITAEDCKLPCFKSSWLSRVLSGGHMKCLVSLFFYPRIRARVQARSSSVLLDLELKKHEFFCWFA